MTIQNNINQIRADIEQLAPGRQVRLVAVTKTVGIQQMREALDAGITDMAENRALLLEEKYAALKDIPGINWHFIGHLQTNKVNKVVPIADLIHSVDSLRLAEKINECAARLNKKQKILLEVNISGEARKHGFAPDDISKNFELLEKLQNTDIMGLMMMAPFGASTIEQHQLFGGLKKLAVTLGLNELSMGMSQDYQIALQEGSTMVRIGSSIFN